MKLSKAEELNLALCTMLGAKGVVGFKIARNLRMINEELKEYHNVRFDLFKKYGELGEDNSYRIEKGTENFKKFSEEIAPYDNQEVEFNFRKITEDELANSDLTAEQMGLIWDYMIEVKE